MFSFSKTYFKKGPAKPVNTGNFNDNSILLLGFVEKFSFFQIRMTDFIHISYIHFFFLIRVVLLSP